MLQRILFILPSQNIYPGYELFIKRFRLASLLVNIVCTPSELDFSCEFICIARLVVDFEKLLVIKLFCRLASEFV